MDTGIGFDIHDSRINVVNPSISREENQVEAIFYYGPATDKTPQRMLPVPVQF